MATEYTWQTPMRDDGEHSTLRGQIGARLLPGGEVHVVVMAARNTFATDAVISAEDVRAMVAALDARPAPQRATDTHGTVYRMHMPCRRVMIESRSACRYCDEAGAWTPLYTLGGAA